MASKKEFSDPFWSSYRRGLKEGFVFPLLAALLVLACNAVYPIARVEELRRYPGGWEKIKNILYLVNPPQRRMGQLVPDMLFCIVLAFCSILAAVVLFRFATGKKAVNAYFSLGISRKSLFASQYLAGATLLAGAAVVPMGMNLVWNLASFGSSPQLWITWFYFTVGYLVVMLLAFGVGAAVMSCVGTLAEGIAFSSLILAGPAVLSALLHLLASLFLPGSRSLGSYSAMTLGQSIEMESPWFQRLVYDPVLFLQKSLGNLGGASKNGEDPWGLIRWEAPDWKPLLFWGMVVLLVFGAGLFLFRRRKAEKAGFFGANRVLNAYAAGMLGLGTFTLASALIRRMAGQGKWLSALCGLLGYAVIYAAADAALVRNKKLLRRDLLPLPAHLGFVLVITVTLSTGLFGRFNQPPALDQIEKAYISAPLTDDILRMDQGYLSTKAIRLPQDSLIGGLTDRPDLEMVQAIQKELAKSSGDFFDSNQGQTAGMAVIIYQLKDGTQKVRFYDHMSVSATKKWISVLGAQWVGKTEAALLRNTNRVCLKVYNGTDRYHAAYLFDGQGNPVGASLTGRRCWELRKALAKDMETRTVQQTLFPEQVFGKIAFMAQGSGETIQDESERAAAMASSLKIEIPVTGTMSHTLAFLKGAGLLDQLHSRVKVLGAQVSTFEELFPRAFQFPSMNRIYQFVFRSSNEEMRDAGEEDTTNYITDSQKIDRLQKVGKKCWYTNAKGYYITYKLENGRCYSEFIPEEQAPDFVKDLR